MVVRVLEEGEKVGCTVAGSNSAGEETVMRNGLDWVRGWMELEGSLRVCSRGFFKFVCTSAKEESMFFRAFYRQVD